MVDMIIAIAANLLLAVLMIVLPVIWIVSLAKWDGKCPCDKTLCKDCPYYGTCKYELQEDDLK